MRRSQASRRTGFTLIEMLVVMLIILLLVGLLLPAVQKARDAAVRAQTKSEIAGLGTAIENFKSTYDVKYIPSFLMLTQNYNPPSGAGAAQIKALNESREFYSKVWPKAFIPGQPGVTPLGNDTAPPNYVYLDGNQLLVFLLGGVGPASTPLPPNGEWPASFQGQRLGFVNSPTNPFGYSNGATYGPNQSAQQAKGPFFDFKADRVDMPHGHFHDPYWKSTNDPNSPDLDKSVYYYFSSKYGNDYYYWGAVYSSAGITAINAAGGYGGMNPHAGIDQKYIEPNGYQIVSTGRDQAPSLGATVLSTSPLAFDASTLWPGAFGYKKTPGGFDDLGNWTSSALGAD